METILRHNNLSLLHDLDRLHQQLRQQESALSREWKGFCEWAVKECENLHNRARVNLRDLASGHSSILPDVLSQTQAVTRDSHKFNRQVWPVLRAAPIDRAPLRVLHWLHLTHPETQQIPLIVSNEEFSVWPIIPTTYFLPSAAQQGLLYLALFFHEFGHLLYALHHPEMDDLVKGLQEVFADVLLPMSHLDDAMAAQVLLEQQIVVERWYEWTQELFCDAVGLTIGGISFVRAFSTYLRMCGRSHFQIPKEELESHEHPVTWLRISVLADRLRRNGDEEAAEALSNEWRIIASTMGIMEDYFGFYTNEFLDPLQRTLDDMLTETGPAGLDANALRAPAISGYTNPIPILTEAWDQFTNSPKDYPAWEGNAVEVLLSDV